MPRNGSGVMSKVAGTTAVPGQVIESAKYNATIDDIIADLNAARPVVAGGTGATSAATARTNLGVDPSRTFVTKSAGYTALAADKAANIRFDGAYTLSLTAAATLGSGWYCFVQADGGDVVIDPNASETINGAATITLPDGYSTTIWCDGSNFRAHEDPTTIKAVADSIANKQDNSGELYRGLINGLTLSNNGTDATNDIDIATGSAGSDGTTPVLMTLASALTKRLDAAWAVGTGNGGLDTGSIANTTYHVWLIQRSDTGVVDALFSTSATSPTMPTNYDRKRRIGPIVRVSAAIKGFVQSDDRFIWKDAVIDVDAQNPGTSAVTRTLTLPTGIAVIADITLGIFSGTTAFTARVSSLDTTDQSPQASSTAALTGFSSVGSAATGSSWVFSSCAVKTNTSAQVRTRLSASGAADRVGIITNGWIDSRGR